MHLISEDSDKTSASPDNADFKAQAGHVQR